MPPLIVLAFVLMLAVFTALLLASRPDSIAAMVIIGIVFAALGLLLDLLPSGNMQMAITQNVVAQGSTYFIGYPLAGVGLAFWLTRRYSNVTLEWAQQGAYSCGALLTLAGLCITAARLTAVSGNGLVGILSTVGLAIIPFAYVIFAAHMYRVLSDRNQTATLAAHWLALAVLCWLIGAGISTIFAIPGVSVYIVGTQLAQTQMTLFGLGVLAVILGMINQTSAELRGINVRITGLMPFWLVAFGGVGAALIQAAAGTVQVFMTRVSGVGFLDTEAAIAPLYLLWVLCLMVMAAGALAYLTGFWARRPYEQVAAATGTTEVTNA